MAMPPIETQKSLNKRVNEFNDEINRRKFIMNHQDSISSLDRNSNNFILDESVHKINETDSNWNKNYELPSSEKKHIPFIGKFGQNLPYSQTA